MSIDSLPPLRDVIARHGLAARKSLGQNFLLDLNLTGRIARAAGPLAGRTVYEVGPGPGGLTRALLAAGAEKLVVVERDDRALPALHEIGAAYPGRLTIVPEDAMRIDAAALGESGKIRIVANLPYNIGTALLIRWLTISWPPFWESMTLMFQREVAERIIAAPGSKTYGRLSILAQWRARPKILFSVPASAFTPPPKVTSAVVHFTPTQPMDPTLSLAALERVTEAAFSQRRKMLRASLRTLCSDPEALLESVGIEPTARAETIDVAGFCRLARAWETVSADPS